MDLVAFARAVGIEPAPDLPPRAQLARIRVAASGVLTLDDALRLEESGVPILQRLADGQGVSRDQVASLIRSGRISFDMMEGAIRG